MGDVQPFRKRRSSSSTPTNPGESPRSFPDLGDRASALLSAVARGDERAFADFYDLMAPLLFGVVLRVVRDPSQSEEVVQEAFATIWRQAPRFDATKGSAKSWACAIAHRRAVDVVRSVEASRRRDTERHEQADLAPASVEELVTSRLDGERMRQAMDSLTDPQRAAIELAYDRGLTYREVAALLDIPEGTAKTRIRDGLIRLRDHLGVMS